MLKLTAREVEKLLEDGKVLETFNEETANDTKTKNGIVEFDNKFYQIEYAEILDGCGTVVAWIQNAPEVEKVTKKVTKEITVWEKVNLDTF